MNIFVHTCRSPAYIPTTAEISHPLFVQLGTEMYHEASDYD